MAYSLLIFIDMDFTENSVTYPVHRTFFGTYNRTINRTINGSGEEIYTGDDHVHEKFIAKNLVEYDGKIVALDVESERPRVSLGKSTSKPFIVFDIEVPQNSSERFSRDCENNIFKPTFETCMKHIENSEKIKLTKDIIGSGVILVKNSCGMLCEGIFVNLKYQKCFDVVFNFDELKRIEILGNSLEKTQKLVSEYHSTISMLIEKVLDVEDKNVMIMEYVDNLTKEIQKLSQQSQNNTQKININHDHLESI